MINTETLKKAQVHIRSAIKRIRTETELSGVGYTIPKETLEKIESNFINAHRLIDIAQGIQPKDIEKLKKI